MDKVQGQVPKNTKTKTGRWKKFLTVLPLVTLVGVGSALSKGAFSPVQQPGAFGSNCLPERPAITRGMQDCMLERAEHYNDSRPSSAAVATTGSSTPFRNEDAPSKLPQGVKLDGPMVCLALNIYWEARNQNIAGQLAVAQVTMNRFYDPRYPDDVCEVVYDHKQFSWYWDGQSDTPKEKRAWDKAVLIASAAINGSGHAELQGVTHYHAVYSKPYWKDYMTKVAMIGDHVFYVN
jgi:hypothetical protein